MHALAPIDWTASWLVPWAQTPGFGGVAAVLAATIAFAAARYQARVQRAAQRKEQWWKRAEWALDLTLSDDPDTRAIGFQVLAALSQSEWTREHEHDVIAAAVDRYDPGTPSTAELSNLQVKSEIQEGSTDDNASTPTAISGADS